jgi:hypothetical protein
VYVPDSDLLPPQRETWGYRRAKARKWLGRLRRTKRWGEMLIRNGGRKANLRWQGRRVGMHSTCKAVFPVSVDGS